MVAKVIAWGRDRSEALARLRNALRETTVVIDGGTTTKSFLLDLLDREEVISASADTGWLDRTDAGIASGPDRRRRHRPHRRRHRRLRRRGRPRAHRVPRLRSRRTPPRQPRHRPHRRAELPGPGLQARRSARSVPHRYQRRRRRHGETRRSTSSASAPTRAVSVIGDRRYQVVTVAGAAHFLVEVDGISHQISQDEAGLVRAPAPAVVVAVPVAVGDEVEAGQTLVVLESMKMETAVRVPVRGHRARGPRLGQRPGRRRSCAAARRSGRRAEGLRAGTSRASSVGVDDAAQRSPQRRALERLDELAALITGYDVSGARARNLFVRAYETLRAEVPRDDSRAGQRRTGVC